jgi:hypothetical protein
VREIPLCAGFSEGGIVTSKERNDILIAGWQLAMTIDRLYPIIPLSEDRASARIARERWDRAYADYIKRNRVAKTRRA